MSILGQFLHLRPVFFGPVCMLPSAKVCIWFLQQSNTTYFSSSDWSALDFFLADATNNVVTHLENIQQLNKRRGKKLGFQLSHT